MAETITYGSYTFPSPTPLIAQGVDPIYVKGKVDNFSKSSSDVQIIKSRGL